MARIFAGSATHKQDIPSTEWNVNHALEGYPSVTVMTPRVGGGYDIMIPKEIRHTAGNVVIVFSSPTVGLARLV